MSDTRPLALVTGGLHRIGAAIAARLAEAGYDLALHRRKDGEPDANLVRAIAAAGINHSIFSADLGQSGAAEALFADVTRHFGRAPALIVNNASLFAEGGIGTLDRTELNAALAVNLTAPVLLTQALYAIGSQGAVINILDQRIRNPVPDQIGYTLSKQALSEATRTLAMACAPRVRVNAVAPGLTLSAPGYEAGRMERMAVLMPLERLATPQYVADAVLFLAQTDSITGQTIFVDGGANLKSFDRDFAYL
jgi:NAD(P)-dependent dehydrogenase (short-subunit alcohol dehydrogenase family)